MNYIISQNQTEFTKKVFKTKVTFICSTEANGLGIVLSKAINNLPKGCKNTRIFELNGRVFVQYDI